MQDTVDDHSSNRTPEVVHGGGRTILNAGGGSTLSTGASRGVEVSHKRVGFGYGPLVRDGLGLSPILAILYSPEHVLHGRHKGQH